jgi:Domain of unknown function (DUF4169)
MSNIVNLNRFRKGKERAEKVAKAAENRAAYGRPKSDRDIEKAREDKAGKALDQHRLDKDET